MMSSSVNTMTVEADDKDWMVKFCNRHKIPYVFINLKPKGAGDKQMAKIPNGWSKKSFEELVGDDVKFDYIISWTDKKTGEKHSKTEIYGYSQRKNSKSYYNAININLYKANLVIADLDDKGDMPKHLKQFGKK